LRAADAPGAAPRSEIAWETVDSPSSHDGKRRGVCEYGTLAGALGKEFEHKWLRADGVDKQSLGATDLSATTDLYSIVGNVYAMSDVPFGLRDLIGPVVGTLVPFVPIVFLVMPLQTILADLADLLL
jgi:hypothetical protein